ncbi:MAG: toll/interleukin-1 receptor domain-containing protein [Chitinophagaceae bacterium]
MPKPITIFISYAHKDGSYLSELQTFLKPYQRNKTIDIWTDREIVAGQQWNELIKNKLSESEIILFLVSPDFLASDYINDTEIKSAITDNKIITIPVIIRPIDMDLFTISYKQAVPTGAKAVSDWDSRDKAWNDVLLALKEVFKKINKDEPDYEPLLVNGTKKNIRIRDINFSDMLMKGLFVLLIVVCIGAFVYGLIKRDNYYSFTSLAGLGIGATAWFLLRRQLAH